MTVTNGEFQSELILIQQYDWILCECTQSNFINGRIITSGIIISDIPDFQWRAVVMV